MKEPQSVEELRTALHSLIASGSVPANHRVAHQAVEELARALQAPGPNEPTLTACERLCGALLVHLLEVKISSTSVTT